jgi:conjugal transfer pilus assembly protein TraL
MSQDSYIPQHLDEPERYIFFTADEGLALVVPAALLTLFSNFLVGLLLGGACVIALRRFKQGGPLTRLLWRLYWITPSALLGLRATPASHLRLLAG